MDTKSLTEQSPFVRLWCENIKRAQEKKHREFDKQADEVLKFYNGNHDWIFDKKDGEERSFRGPGDTMMFGDAAPEFKMTVNRVFEFVSIFGPMMYNRNPSVTITPRKPADIPPMAYGDPMMAQIVMQAQQQQGVTDDVVCNLLSSWLNYLPNETNMRRNARMGIIEALLKGMGALHTDVFTRGHSGRRMVRAQWLSVDDIVLDPDARTPEDIQWMAIKCIHPVSRVEQEYDIPKGIIKGSLTSTFSESSSTVASDGRSQTSYTMGEKNGKTYDQLLYWKVYSKIGVGRPPKNDRDADLTRQIQEAFGMNVFFVIAPSVPFPLNMPPWLDVDPRTPEGQQVILPRVSWQIPYYEDNAWPVEFLRFHENPNHLYPIGHISPAIGEQYALDWISSMALSKLRAACRTLVGVTPDVDEDAEEQIKSGKDYAIIKLLKQGKLDEMIQPFQFGTFNPEIWNVKQDTERAFEKRTGMLDNLYGGQGPRQLRTAAEASNLQGNLNIRPDDMRENVEDWLTRAFRRMALASRFALNGNDVMPYLGKANAHLWDIYVASTDTDKICCEYEYRIESGSTRKPNQDTYAANLEQTSQTLLPLLAQMTKANPENFEALNWFLKELAKSRTMDWPIEIKAPPPPPPMPPPGMGPQGPPPGPGRHGPQPHRGHMPPPHGGPPPGPPPGPQGPPPEQQGPPQGLPPELMAQLGGGGQPPQGPPPGMPPQGPGPMDQGASQQQPVIVQPTDMTPIAQAMMAIAEMQNRPKKKLIQRDQNGLITETTEVEVPVDNAQPQLPEEQQPQQPPFPPGMAG